ncbi:phage baseplate assembly protein V [Bacilliculturomica massiliensis]|uniref:phage baseplate assembly protein V n=1 Tax=Bacilliculturomica massiliensis TaxID=1917867 RepID=UPI0010303B9E|nr:phage baseplate assembly protein V [Bacilliculturomica massiliensis]
MGLLSEFTGQENEGRSIAGVTTGVVKENWNKDYPGKVKVEILLGEEGQNVTGWIPVMTQYSGSGFGFYALPEVGAEVVVAFNMGDRNCPIVLGTLWNNKNKLQADTANDKNTIKSFRTKGGCEVTFDDENGKARIEVKSPGKFTISIEDEKKQILIKDEKGENGIRIDAEKGELEISAKTKIELKVGGKAMVALDGNSKTAQIKADNIKAEAGQALQLKGQNDTIEGSMLNIKAQSSLKAESGGMLEVKGAMVKIN